MNGKQVKALSLLCKVVMPTPIQKYTCISDKGLVHDLNTAYTNKIEPYL